jgi:hypothetical protein
MQGKSLLIAVCGILLATTAVRAQSQHPSSPWRAAGATPCVGTDGGVEHGGLTPVRAIQAATTINPEVFGWQDQIGSIEKNKSPT